MSRTRIVHARWLITSALALAMACSSEPAGPEDPADPPDLEDVNAYLQSVSSWPDPPDSIPPEPTDSSRTSRTTVDSVKVVDDVGGVSWNEDVEYVCTTTPYSFSKTPEKIVMFSPDRDILFPGALLQGKSHAEGSGGPGSLDPLPIGQRAAVQVSIPSLPTGDNERTVDAVTQGNIDSAIGDMIGSAAAEGLFTPASDDFEVETYNSESEFALKTKLSGRYLRFSGSASGSTARNTSETTIAVRYIQKLYEVTVPLPQTPQEFFTDEFTPERLQEQVELGRIGPDNQPIYVANVVYGRMMMFTLTAQATASEMQAIVNASYDGVVTGVDASLDARQQEILSSSRVAISTYGGGRDGSQGMIRSGDWREYFTRDVLLQDALPLSYTFRTLTGEVAAVIETTNYEVETCQPLGDVPLEYPNDGAAQFVGAPVPAPYASHLGDVTGDGIADLILNHLSPTENAVAILSGAASGVFGAPVVSEAPSVPAGGWANYTLMVGDVDGQGASNGGADLVWTSVGQVMQPNFTTIGLSASDGTITFLAEQGPHPAGDFNPDWVPMMADLNGDALQDLVWNLRGSNGNYTWFALAVGDGTVAFDAVRDEFGGTTWGGYSLMTGDVDRDGNDDLIWNSVFLDSPNRTVVARLAGDALVSAAGDNHPTSCCWTGYKRVVGDFDGDQRSDILFLANGRTAHRAYSDGFDAWTFPAHQQLEAIPHRTSWVPHAADFNGDGVDDIIVNDLGTKNEVWITYGSGAIPGVAGHRTFVEPRLQPEHPADATWTSVQRLLVGDITGEGRADLVWVVPGASGQVYVGLGRQ